MLNAYLPLDSRFSRACLPCPLFAILGLNLAFRTSYCHQPFNQIDLWIYFHHCFAIFTFSNPALRSGPRSSFRPGVPITGRRGRYFTASGSLTGGWDTDGNDYALSLGSGSERSFR